MTEHPEPSPGAREPMIDARHASYALHLPYYWFSDPKMRAKKRIPHYRLGGLVRFRISEIEAWWGQHRVVAASERVE